LEQADGVGLGRSKPAKPTEDAIGEGFVRKDGRVTPMLPKDSLAKRAAAEEEKWLRGEKLETKGARIFRSKRRRAFCKEKLAVETSYGRPWQRGRRKLCLPPPRRHP
jgi:hypothetical protein